MTSSPSVSRRSQRCDPMKPAAPVTRALLMSLFLRLLRLGDDAILHVRGSVLVVRERRRERGAAARFRSQIDRVAQDLALGDLRLDVRPSAPDGLRALDPRAL